MGVGERGCGQAFRQMAFGAARRPPAGRRGVQLGNRGNGLGVVFRRVMAAETHEFAGHQAAG